MEAGRDTDAVEMVLSHNEYRVGLRQRSVPFDVYTGYDHEGLNHSLDIALPQRRVAVEPGEPTEPV
jgi:hypothetical protein